MEPFQHYLHKKLAPKRKGNKGMELETRAIDPSARIDNQEKKNLIERLREALKRLMEWFRGFGQFSVYAHEVEDQLGRLEFLQGVNDEKLNDVMQKLDELSLEKEGIKEFDDALKKGRDNIMNLAEVFARPNTELVIIEKENGDKSWLLIDSVVFRDILEGDTEELYKFADKDSSVALISRDEKGFGYRNDELGEKWADNVMSLMMDNVAGMTVSTDWPAFTEEEMKETLSSIIDEEVDKIARDVAEGMKEVELLRAEYEGKREALEAKANEYGVIHEAIDTTKNDPRQGQDKENSDYEEEYDRER